MTHEEIYRKIEGAETFPEIRERLTDEELVYYVLHTKLYNEFWEDGDECLVTSILQLLKASRRSTRHSLFLLEQAKDALLQLSWLKL